MLKRKDEIKRKRKWPLLIVLLIATIPAVAYALSTQPNPETKNQNQIVQNKDNTVVANIEKTKELGKLDPFPKVEVSKTRTVARPILNQVSQPTSAKMFIYLHESGNDPKRWNTSGCVGLGQACPAAKLLAVCPNLDYACEDAWFTRYAINRYGSWENAKAFWLVHRWW